MFTLFRTQDPENHTVLGGTYPFGPNKGVPSPPPTWGGARIVNKKAVSALDHPPYKSNIIYLITEINIFHLFLTYKLQFFI